MNSIRQNIFSKILALIAGLAFLNMSFLLAEVAMLKVEEGQLIENIANLILNTGFEEEKDSEAADENLSKEVNLLVQQVQIHSSSSFSISEGIHRMLVNHYRHANHSLNFSPPPDFQHFS